MPILKSEGTVVQANEKTYWFKDDFKGVQVSTLQAISLVEGVVGRELDEFESSLLISRPFDGSTNITIASMLASDPTERNYLKSIKRVVIGYAVRRREKSTRFNYGDIIGTDAFYDTDGKRIGELRITRKQEPPLETPLLDPIDFLGGALADIVRIGAKMAIELAEERAALYLAKLEARAAPEVVGGMAGSKGSLEAFWRAGLVAPRQFTAAEQKAWSATIKSRMKKLGIPNKNIGIRGIPGESGEAFNALGDMRGSNVRGKGISVHGNVMEDWAGFPEWNAASVETRIDATIAHEWMEFNELTHWETVELAIESKLPISKEARQLLAAMQKKGVGWKALADKPHAR